jgi:hypothetical protein
MLSVLMALTLFCAWAAGPDAEVVIYEQTLNKLLQAIGEIKGQAAYKVWFHSGTYQWKLRDTKMILLNDSARFSTRALVETGISDYEDLVEGKMAVRYDQKKNKVMVQLLDAPFEVYVKFLGQRVRITTIQIADYFKEPMMFDGPGNAVSDMEIALPDGSVKKIQGIAKNTRLKIEPGKIRVSSDIQFK